MFDTFLRMTLAALAGLALGLERNIKKKPIDFRSNIIVSITGALAAMIMLQMTASMPLDRPGLGLDPTRAVQGVLMGIAFLGSATIIRYNSSRVVGTATGSTVWACGGIGVAYGCGYFLMATLATVYILIVLAVIGYFMPEISDRSDYGDEEPVPSASGNATGSP